MSDSFIQRVKLLLYSRQIKSAVSIALSASAKRHISLCGYVHYIILTVRQVQGEQPLECRENVIKRIRNHKKTNNTTASSETDIEENNDQTASPIERHHVAPHVRREHWQSYWVGKKDGSGERRRGLR